MRISTLENMKFFFDLSAIILTKKLLLYAYQKEINPGKRKCYCCC